MKREKLKIPLRFDDAISDLLKVKPPKKKRTSRPVKKKK
jgi:hypothetical protein